MPIIRKATKYAQFDARYEVVLEPKQMVPLLRQENTYGKTAPWAMSGDRALHQLHVIIGGLTIDSPDVGAIVNNGNESFVVGGPWETKRKTTDGSEDNPGLLTKLSIVVPGMQFWIDLVNGSKRTIPVVVYARFMVEMPT